MSKIKLRLLVAEGADYFLRWELPYFQRHFELVSEPADDVVLMNFAPRKLGLDLELPALKRVVVLMPGYVNPYYDLEQRAEMLDMLEKHYDLALVNPGPLEIALSSCTKVISHPFSVDIDTLRRF